MGLNMVERLRGRGYEISVYDRSPELTQEAVRFGASASFSLVGMAAQLTAPRLIWLMVPHAVVDEVLNELSPHLQANDAIIDGGNSFYKDSVRRARELEKKGIDFLDVGVSGGPSGARTGACVMVGGKEETFKKFESLFKDIAAENAYAYVGKAGAGHFVKMAHNGIEYGMMQALAEGFGLLKKSDFQLDLKKVADLYNHRSVIESRLVGWLEGAYEKYGIELESISGAVGHTGEGEWTVKIANELGVPVPIIEGAFQFRVQSNDKPTYTGKVLSALRNMFGGHAVK